VSAGRAVNCPRRQQHRRLGRAVRCAALASLAAVLALAAASAGSAPAAISLALAGAGFAIRARRWIELARRSAIGATSEDRVRQQLDALVREGWRVRHAIPWHGGGDVDHIAIAPQTAAVTFAIETKTRSYAVRDLERISRIAEWLALGRPGWGAGGTIPVLCLAGRRGVERFELGVAVVSIDRLVPVLRRLAGTTPRPRFLR
jgi:hypothetical protein